MSKSLARNTLLYAPAQLFGPSLQFGVTIVWTHLLDPAAFGVVTFMIAMQEFTGFVGLSWWSIFVVRFQQRFAGGEARRFRAMDSRMVASGALAQVIFTAPTLLLIGVPPHWPIMTAAASYLVTRTLLGHYGEWARANHHIRVYTIGQLAGPVAGALLSVAAVLLFGPDPAIALAAITLGQAAGLAAMLFALGVRPSLGAFDRVTFTDAFRYGAPLIASGAFTMIATNGVRIIVEMREGLVGVGLFSAGWGLGQRLAVACAMLCTAAAFPLAVERLERGDRAGALRQVAANSALMLALLAPAIVGVALLSGPMVRFLIAPQFQDATMLILPIATATGAARMLRSHTGDQTGLLLEKTRTMVVFNLTDAFCSLFGGAVGVYAFGVVGAAVGTLIGACIAAIASILYAVVELGLPILGWALGRILLATGLMGVALTAAPNPGNILTLALEIVFGAAIYGIAALILFPEARRPLWARLLGARAPAPHAAPTET